MPTHQIYNAFLTVFVPRQPAQELGEFPDDGEPQAPIYLQHDIDQIQLLINQFFSALCPNCFWGWCLETCPGTGKLHFHVAFQLPPDIRVSSNKVRKFLSTIDLGVHLEYPLKCTAGPKAVSHYLMKGTQPHAEWEALGRVGRAPNPKPEEKQSQQAQRHRKRTSPL